jgi:hypothetical protein
MYKKEQTKDKRVASRGKFAPATTAENNRRITNGKLWIYYPFQTRWDHQTANIDSDVSSTVTPPDTIPTGAAESHSSAREEA